ncbi:oxygenase MpaB family protein [Kutzneria chonburiensis]|uniref:Oxygenase MpaB family protein n=1 Tax=Kutzneria chonburiensis TaxID=1483604 RepID=A0ABV6N8B2_9PSEU|nr:oxygenase MpaB family protein [Kutzneria chonburiensis]
MSTVNLPAAIAVVTPQSLRPLRDGFDTPRVRADEGLIGDDSVLRRYTAPWLPMVLGGWSAFTTLVLVDHMRQSISMVMAHRPGFNEFRQLTRGMIIAIFGDSEQVEEQRVGAWNAHARLRGVDADGREWTANDPDLTARVYTVLMWHLLAAQEKLIGRLDESDRDAYCADAVRTVGQVFGNPAVLPVTYEQLAAEYATVLKGLTVTPEALAVFQENRALLVKDVPMEDLVAATAGLLDPEVADVFGIDRSAVVEFPRIDLATVTEDDMLPMACVSR